MRKTTEEKKSWLQKRGWFKTKTLEKRDIDFTPIKREEIVMVNTEAEEAVLPPRMDRQVTAEEVHNLNMEELRHFQERTKILPLLTEHKETKSNDDMRKKRKVVSFVSGEDYEALERELWGKDELINLLQQKLNDIRKILQL